MNSLYEVLVVDDSQIIIKKLSMLLEKVGYRVVRTAATGREAIVAYRACKPDVVTMDITMPDMDGIQATRAIMSEFPDAKIIMVTSHGQEQMVLEALKAGAKGYVLKPFEEHKVYEAIQKVCKGRVVLQDKLKAVTEEREKAKLEVNTEQISTEHNDTDGSDGQSSGSSQLKTIADVSVETAQHVGTQANTSQQQQIICNECGKLIAINAKFCSECGSRLS